MFPNLDEVIKISPYSADWPLQAALEIARLATVLEQVPIEHIGSTAIPGMIAKPIIDLQAGLSTANPTKQDLSHLEEAGYEDFGEAGVPGRRYLRRRGQFSFNLHLVQLDGTHWRRNLLLRDFLRTHPDEARDYDAAKRRAAERNTSLLAYSDEKAPMIQYLLLLAEGKDAIRPKRDP